MHTNLKSATPLSTLLKHLHISSLSLAQGIHVDPSLVSRWRNGKRKFGAKSTHFRRVIDFILDSDASLDYQNIISFLRGIFPNKKIVSRQDAFKAIYLFLSQPDPYFGHASYSLPSTAHSTTLELISGDKEKESALINLMEQVLSCEPPVRLMLMFSEETDGLMERDDFYDTWIECLKAVIDAGHEVHYIYSNSNIRSNIVNLENFLFLCQKSNFNGYYLHQNTIPSFDLFLLEGHVMFTNLASSPKKSKSVLFCCSHPDVIDRGVYQYENMLTLCSPLFRDNSSEVNQIINALHGLRNFRSHIYLYGSSVFILPVSAATFAGLLELNHFSPAEKHAALARYDTLISAPFNRASNYSFNIILNTDNILHSFKESEQVFFPKLFSSKEIVIPKSYYQIYLNDILETLTENKSPANSTISLVTKSLPISQNVFVYTVENMYTYVYSDVASTEYDRLFFTDTLFNGEIYQYLDKFYHSLPEESSSFHRLVLLLSQLLE